MAPRSQTQGKAPRTRRTRAQIEEDLKLFASVLPNGSRPTAAKVKRSRLAAQDHSKNTSSATSSKMLRDSPPFDLVNYQTIIAYLSKANMQNALFEGGSQTRVSGLPMNPKTLLNLLAIELNNTHNVCNDSNKMQLNRRVLHMRLKRYKSKHTAAKAFSEKTGRGLLAKNVADGVNTMDALLESMCPCYNKMNALFGEKGNVTPFGILDSSTGTTDCCEEGSDGDTTDGHYHGLTERMDLGRRNQEGQRAFVEDPKEIEAYTKIFQTQSDDDPHEDDDPVSRPPTPNTFDEPPPLSPQARQNVPDDQAPSTSAVVNNPLHQLSNTHPACQTYKKKSSTAYARRVEGLTEQEQALDSSSEEDAVTTTTAATQAPTLRVASCSTIARRPVDPLPSIDPSHAHGKEHKHALALAIQKGNKAKLDLLNKANKWRQHMETTQLKEELQARASSLTWDKEKYFLEREDQQIAEQRHLEQDAQKERKAFCKRSYQLIPNLVRPIL